MSDTYTEDLADIMQCSEERRQVLKILKAWDENGLPEQFYDNRVRFGFNRNSGFVFLVNDDYQCAMLKGGKLEHFYSSPYDGVEGFFEDLVLEFKEMHPDDQEWFLDVAKGLKRESELDDRRVLVA
ncbi:hypothetical protein EBZ39_15980 [bacterium]|nr:hypothetical protein [bacterium]